MSTTMMFTPEVTATNPTTTPTNGQGRHDWVAVAAEIGGELAPTVADHDRTGEISIAAFDLLRRDGVTRALVPSECGGGGATHAEVAALLRELGRHDPATAVTLSMHSHVVATQLWRHRHGLDASAVFEKVVGGAIIANTGASDWVESSGAATKVDGGYRVSGRKAPASGCEVADMVATSFRWEVADEPAQVIHCTIPCGADGVGIDLTWDTLGLRATGSHTLVFEDVFVPDAAVALVRPAAEWPALLNTVLPAALPLIMSAYVGMADAAVAEVRRAAEGRDDPHVVQLVGEMTNAHVTTVDAVEAMIREADDLQFDNTDELASRTLARKTIASDSVIACVRLGIEATGGMGYTRRSVLERLYRDVHGCLFHPLPRAKQLRFTGRVGVGLDPIG